MPAEARRKSDGDNGHTRGYVGKAGRNAGTVVAVGGVMPSPPRPLFN